MIHHVSHWRWPHFQPYEVLSPTGITQYMQGNLMLQPYALDMLDTFREMIKTAIVCNSSTLRMRGYRSQAENKDAEGCLLSRHMQGIAFDISIPALTLDQAQRAAIDFGFGAVGIYPRQGFIHVDCRAVLNGKPITWQQ